MTYETALDLFVKELEAKPPPGLFITMQTPLA
jgi:hypothetical protein